MRSYSAVLVEGSDIDAAKQMFEQNGAEVTQCLQRIRVITFKADDAAVERIRGLSEVLAVEKDGEVRVT